MIPIVKNALDRRRRRFTDPRLIHEQHIRLGSITYFVEDASALLPQPVE